MTGTPRAATVLAVAVGGAAGTVARYELALAEPVRAGQFPWATFVVNVTGSLVLGLVLALLAGRSRSTVLRPFLAVGVCGGLTTFSTWMVESMLLIRGGDVGVATLYLGLSLVAGLLAVAVGVMLGGRLRPATPPLAFDTELDA